MSKIEEFLKIHGKGNFNNTNKPIAPKNIFTFGKYKGISYQEIYNTDKSYVAFVMGADPKYYSRVQNFYKSLIENEN